MLQTAAGRARSLQTRNGMFIYCCLSGSEFCLAFSISHLGPEAYAAAPAPAAMLHAGVLKKFGLYGLLRLAIPMLPEGARHWATLLIVLLLGNIIMSDWSQSRRSGSIGCSVIRA